MNKFFICLAVNDWEGERYLPGDIIVRTEETPNTAAWASFEPGELAGNPVRIPAPYDDGSGNLVFGYQILETGEHFIIRCRAGVPTAKLVFVPQEALKYPVPPAEEPVSPGPPQPDRLPPNGTGMENVGVTSCSYSAVRWRPGGATPEPSKPEEVDLLRNGLDGDLLRRGLE